MIASWDRVLIPYQVWLNSLLRLTLVFWEVCGPSDGLGSQAAYRDIAKATQEQFGGRVSYERAAGFVISLTALAPFNSGQQVTLSIMGDPGKSLYQNILEQYGFDPEDDELEEAACRAPTNV
ncbi:hypothetical protein NBRC116493_31360 [Aurantivibrio infirmus]